MFADYFKIIPELVQYFPIICKAMVYIKPTERNAVNLSGY